MSSIRVLCLKIIALYMAGWVSGDDIIPMPYTQAYEVTGYTYNPKDVYEPMTMDPILTGTIDLPPCIKNLMNCWEMLNPDVLCKYGDANYRNYYLQVRFDTICMDLRFQCREYTGQKPFPRERFLKMKILDRCGRSTYLNDDPWYKYNGNPSLAAGTSP